MKKVFYSLFLLLAILACVTTGCDEEHDNVRPGLYVEDRHIESFPGDTVLISGQVSNYVGLDSIKIMCQAWGINKVYDLSSQKPTVFEFNYQMPIPNTATFDQNVYVSVFDKNGLETKEIVVLSFIPDTECPTSSELFTYNSADFDVDLEKGSWTLDLICMDDRELSMVRFEMPGLGIDERIKNVGRSMKLKRTMEFTQTGRYPMTITLTDAANNVTVLNSVIEVIPREDEDPIEDYNQMYVVSDLDEDPADYINGYYRYMKRISEYKYRANIYAADSESGFYFVPTQTMDKALYGVSPYTNSKLMNKNGYVKPLRMDAPGYYTITIDLYNHNYAVTPLDVSNAYQGEMFAGGDGFKSYDNWGRMEHVNGYIYQIGADQDGTVTPQWGRYYYFYAGWVNEDGSYGTDWTRVFRADAEGTEWKEVNGGNGAVIYQSDYNGRVIMTIDTALPWGTLKKVNE